MCRARCSCCFLKPNGIENARCTSRAKPRRYGKRGGVVGVWRRSRLIHAHGVVGGVASSGDASAVFSFASAISFAAASAPLATSPASQREMRDWFTPMAWAISACDMVRRSTVKASLIWLMTRLCANASLCASTLSIFGSLLLVVAINNAFAHRRGALSLDYPMRWRIIHPSPPTPGG